MKTRGSGHALTESLVLTFIVLAAIYMPLPGIGESAFIWLANALKSFQAHSLYLIALP